MIFLNIEVNSFLTAVRTYVPQAEGWVFESRAQQTSFVKTHSDRSDAKHSAIVVIVMGPRIRPIETLECSLLNGNKCRAKIKTLQLFTG